MTTNNRSVELNFAIIQVLPFLNDLKYLSYKMDLDFCDCAQFWKEKILRLVAEEIQHLRTKVLHGPV